jgi:hypothetical protein
MNVAELMTRGIPTCRPTDSPTYAAQMMWEDVCGMQPDVLREAARAGQPRMYSSHLLYILSCVRALLTVTSC